MFAKFIEYPDVKGYATYERAKKRGEEIAAQISTGKGTTVVSWVVLPASPGRFVPAFNVAQAPGLAGWLVRQTNVCVFN